MLEELLALGHAGAEYDAWLIRIGEGEQFGSGFVAVNPNSKIPALWDRSGPRTRPRLRVRCDPAVPGREVRCASFRPAGAQRAECLSWLFWQMGSAPFLGGGFGHFYAYAPTKIEYAIDRYAMEIKRQLDVLDRRLAESAYLAGDEYTIADIAVWPWYGALVKGQLYGAGEFLEVQSYTHVLRWTEQIAAASGGAARPHGQPHLGPAVEPVARASRRRATSTPGRRTSSRPGRDRFACAEEVVTTGCRHGGTPYPSTRTSCTLHRPRTSASPSSSAGSTSTA